MTEMPGKILATGAALAMSMLTAFAAAQTGPNGLASPQSFDGIADTSARSAAIFTELGKVLTNPRCTNCHPAGDRPHQGDQARLHQPPVFRGVDNHGTATMRCSSCHREANYDPSGMPGHPEWQLAPIEMAWHGKTIAEICQQIRDPARNGNRPVEALIDHIGKDTLVGWGWRPGPGRTPVPGTQEQAGALVAAWVKTGASCPAN
jgi:hypothetical protein